MPQYTINRSKNCLNTTNSFNNVWNNCTVADDLPQLLTWLSPLDLGLRHYDIQECRVGGVGEWLMETEEFKRWCEVGRTGVFNTIRLCAANIDSTDLAMPNFYWYEQFG